MKKNVDIYRKNNISGLPFTKMIAKVFRKSEVLAQDMILAIDENKFESRYTKSEELIRAMSEVYDLFTSETPQGIDTAMQKYCVNNIAILTKINLHNDRELSVTLQQSFFEVGNMWEEYKLPKAVN